ncbi:hypothetical protein MMC09_001948 [Bachmanniomyces sp. S44760]|nr:hypothetical protein [Bachmanniomyces sp. S44760]
MHPSADLGSQMLGARRITEFFRPHGENHDLKRRKLELNANGSIVLTGSTDRTAKTTSRQGQRQDPQNALPDPTSLISSLESTNDKSDDCGESVILPFNPTLKLETLPNDNSYKSLSLQSPESASNRGQRITKNGEVVITNSDEDKDASSALSDVDVILAGGKGYSLDRNIAKERTQVTHETRKRLPLDLDRSKKRSKAKSEYRFSLDTLVAQATKYDAIDDGSALDLKGDVAPVLYLDCKMETRSRQSTRTGLIDDITKDRLEQDDVDRLLDAVNRTAALRLCNTWSFFTSSDVLGQYDQATLSDLQTTKQWYPWMQTSFEWEQGFLSGCVSETTCLERLPNELLQWLLEFGCFEGREDLRNAYMTAFLDAGVQIKDLITSSSIATLFRRLGASDQALRLEQPLGPIPTVHEKTSENSARYPLILAILELLGNAAQYMTAEANSTAICLICRLSLDSALAVNGNFLMRIEDSLTSLFHYAHESPDLCDIGQKLFATVNDNKFRIHLLKNIPSQAPSLNLFRRRLALAFFYEDAAYLSRPVQEMLDLDAMAQRLRLSQSSINRETDYTNLAAMTAILDVAVDNGDPPAFDTGQAAHDEFNNRVDTLAKIIKLMFTRIVDTGNSHMTRTEAKDMLEAFHARLIYAVRTQPKPKKGLFGSSSLKLGTSGTLMAGTYEGLTKTNGCPA